MISSRPIRGADARVDFQWRMHFRSPLLFAKKGDGNFLRPNVVPDEFSPKVEANTPQVVGKLR